MAEEKKLSLAQQQQKDKPKIESLIPRYLPDEKVNLALDFVAWLRENKMSPRHSGAFNGWRANYPGIKPICRLSLSIVGGHEEPNKQGTFFVTLCLQNLNGYENDIINENLQKFILDRIN